MYQTGGGSGPQPGRGASTATNLRYRAGWLAARRRRRDVFAQAPARRPPAQWSVQREGRGPLQEDVADLALSSDVTGAAAARARGALVHEAATAQQRHDNGGARARGLAAREAGWRRCAPSSTARGGARGGAPALPRRAQPHKRRIEQLDGALRRWEERGADDSDSDGGRRSSESDDDDEAAPAPAAAAAAPAAAGPSGVAPAADDDDYMMDYA